MDTWEMGYLWPPLPLSPLPPPWHMRFANEYVRADNPAAFHTERNRSLLLIKLQTSNKQTKKDLVGRDQFFFGLRDQEN